VNDLVHIATHRAAVDEIARSLKALAGARWEIERNRPPHIDRLSVFLPSNNVLYSYVLFALLPLAFAREICLRPATKTRTAVRAVHERMAGALPRDAARRITLCETTQQQFVELSSGSDAVVFNGRYENALALSERLETELFLSFGSGPNPIVVGRDADLADVVGATVAARLYNSGQDCLAPDVVFVHATRYDAFLRELRARVAAVPVLPRGDEACVVGGLVYDDAYAGAKEFLHEHRSNVLAGGRCDDARMEMEPAIVAFDRFTPIHPPELFSPVFVIVRYDDARQIESWLHDHTERERGMYLSAYGEHAFVESRLATTTCLHGATALDVEDGNRALGGYGPRASFVRSRGQIVARPLLLSAELARAAHERQEPSRRAVLAGSA
jgi:acyl-CoA reductase-like NAD-dependent aldehyde dehydrogenase